MKYNVVFSFVLIFIVCFSFLFTIIITSNGESLLTLENKDLSEKKFHQPLKIMETEQLVEHETIIIKGNNDFKNLLNPIQQLLKIE